MGVRTEIVPLVTQASGIAPEFRATDDFLAVRMFQGNAKAHPSEEKHRTASG